MEGETRIKIRSGANGIGAAFGISAAAIDERKASMKPATSIACNCGMTFFFF